MIGQRLKKLRLSQNRTQKEVAVFLQISRQAYGFYENDQRSPDVEMIEKIAAYFGVGPSYIFGEEQTAANPPETLQNPLLDGFEDLNEEDQKRVAEYIKLLKLKYISEKK